MTIGVLFERGMSKRAIARQLGADEKAVRYRLERLATRARDRRSDQMSSVAPFAEAIGEWTRGVAAGRMGEGSAILPPQFRLGGVLQQRPLQQSTL